MFQHVFYGKCTINSWLNPYIRNIRSTKTFTAKQYFAMVFTNPPKLIYTKLANGASHKCSEPHAVHGVLCLDGYCCDNLPVLVLFKNLRIRFYNFLKVSTTRQIRVKFNFSPLFDTFIKLHY